MKNMTQIGSNMLTKGYVTEADLKLPNPNDKKKEGKKQ